jgi:hypothetical protein
MTLLRLIIFAAALAASLALSEAALAQGFFERLFGLRPLPPPPAAVPQYRPLPPPPPGVPGVPPTDWVPESDGTPGPLTPSGPAPARPVAVRPPSEESIVGRDLKLNGTAGSLRIERAAGALRAQLTLVGSKISQPTESCSVKLGGGQPVALSSAGRPDGLARYEVQAPACPIVFDVIEGAVLVTGPADGCAIQEADCRVEPRGLWGPEPASLIAKAPEFEQARGSFDKAVRENYKALAQRAAPQAMRPIVAEQAAFSSEREQVCRSYVREGSHGFCNARYTEARAATLAARLGILLQPSQAETARVEGSRRPREGGILPPPGYDPSYVR